MTGPDIPTGRRRSRSTPARPRTLRTLAALGAALLLAPHLGAQPPAPSAGAAAARSGLTPVPRPSLDAMEPAVRAQLHESRSVLDSLLELPEVPDHILAAAFGGLGQLYLLYDQYEAAEGALANAETLAPADFRWPYFRGAVAENDGRLDAAASHFERALELVPDDLPTLLHLGQVEIDRNRPDAAAARFERALELEPGSAAALHGLGEVAVARGDEEIAARRFESALEAQPGADAIHYQLGLVYRELGALDKAREHLAQRGQNGVQFPDPLIQGLASLSAGSGVHMVQGNQAFADGEYGLAVAAYRRATEAAPDDVTPRKALASALAMAGEVGAALDEFRNVLRRDPNDAVTHYNVATLLVQRGDVDDALRHFRRSVELAPDLADAHYNLGTTLEGIDRFEEAETHLARAIELDPQTVDARLHRARILDRIGRGEEGIRELEALLEARPDDPQVLLSLGAVLARLGRSDEALERYRAVLAQEGAGDGDRAEASRLIGTLLLERGELAAAVEHLHTAAELAPESFEAMMAMATASGRAGRLGEAARFFDRASRLRPRSEEAHFGRATALILDGRDGEARSRLEESLETLGGSVALRHALARLLATSAEARVRDGARALELAQQVVTSQPSFDHAETVAMALAELGRFEDAAGLQRQIIAQAERDGRTALLPGMRERLAGYEGRRPVRSPWSQGAGGSRPR